MIFFKFSGMPVSEWGTGDERPVALRMDEITEVSMFVTVLEGPVYPIINEWVVTDGTTFEQIIALLEKELADVE